MEFVTSQNLPAPGGHYSQGVIAGGLLFISGQLPFDPTTGTFAEGIDAQFSQAMANIEAVLLAADACLTNLVNVHIFITDVEKWPIVNAHYAKLMGAHRPARAIIPCGHLHYGALVEITAIAELPHLKQESL